MTPSLSLSNSKANMTLFQEKFKKRLQEIVNSEPKVLKKSRYAQSILRSWGVHETRHREMKAVEYPIYYLKQFLP